MERISGSPVLRNSPLLQRFFEFITSKAGEGQGEDLSEYTIATQVFGRPETFDPASDTIVRTQAYRLRTKLKEYYANDGKFDPVRVEIPKGHYVSSFTYRAEKHSDVLVGDPDVPPPQPTSSRRAVPSSRRLGALALLGASLLVGLGFYAGVRWGSGSARSSSTVDVPQLTKRFWGGLVGGNAIIIAYTNSVFFETETGDLLRFRGGAVADRGARAGRETTLATAANPALVERAGPLYYEDGYTGTGEVLAVHRLTRILAALGANVIVKRSRLITVDDLRNHDVIFLGSPFENQVLGEMHLPQRFVFHQPHDPPLLWTGRILDQKASGSQPSFYALERDPDQYVIRADYALFNVVPGPAPGRRIVILAGLTTSGTQGAAEFATSEAGLQRIVEALRTDSEGRRALPPYFECLVRVDAAKGLDALTVRYVTGSKVESVE